MCDFRVVDVNMNLVPKLSKYGWIDLLVSVEDQGIQKPSLFTPHVFDVLLYSLPKTEGPLAVAQHSQLSTMWMFPNIGIFMGGKSFNDLNQMPQYGRCTYHTFTTTIPQNVFFVVPTGSCYTNNMNFQKMFNKMDMKKNPLLYALQTLQKYKLHWSRKHFQYSLYISNREKFGCADPSLEIYKTYHDREDVVKEYWNND